jgi:PKD repeat protein
LVSWWPGEGNANDIIGSNNATLVNGATFGSGEVGQAFSLNGAGAFVSASDSPSLDITNQITIEAWIYIDALTPYYGTYNARIVDKSAPGLNNGYLLDYIPDNLRFYAGNNAAAGSTPLPPHQWTHVAGVYDGTSAKVYVDGVLDGSAPGSGPIPVNNLPLTIGANSTGAFGGNYFNGLIDEVSIYDRALSPSEIQAIYNAGSAGKCPPGEIGGVLQATSNQISVTEGTSFSGTVASFTDTDGDPDSNYTATIDWGDGTSPDINVAVSPNNNGGFDVPGMHTYAEEGTYNVDVTITDSDGTSDSTTSTVTVDDANLIAIAAIDSATEGSLQSFLVATFTDDNRRASQGDFSAIINWGDGSSTGGAILTTTPGGFGVFEPHTYAEEGTYDVSVNISDIGGSSATAQSTINVADAPLTATSNKLAGAEGTLFTGQVASFTDGNFSSDTTDFSATIDWGDGSATTNGIISFSGFSSSGATFTMSGSHTYLEEGTYKVSVAIADQGGSSANTTTGIIVAIVPPTAALSGATDGVPGQPRTFTFAAIDVSPVDQAAGFIYTINWGDGTPVLIVPRNPGNGSGISIDHIYTAPGSYTVQETATEDGGSNGSASSVVMVKSVEMQRNTLAVGGTLGNDTIILSPADTVGDINVNYNGVSVGNFLPTDHILVYGQTGNDTIQLASSVIQNTTYYVTVPAFLYGGGIGHDILDASGSTANNVLTGGGGKNDLFGGLGRDLLIAGLGAGKLHAGVGDDMLIGGTTDYDLTNKAMTYDQKLVALEAIMAEWGRTDATYLARVHHLDGSLSGGLNGSFLLNATTVHDNGQADTLFGATGFSLDWFFADPSDTLKHLRTDEVTTGIS